MDDKTRGRAIVRERLPAVEPARTIISMYFLDDIGAPEIARRLGITHAAARKPILAFSRVIAASLGRPWANLPTQIRDALRLPTVTMKPHPRIQSTGRNDAIVAEIFEGARQKDVAAKWGITAPRVGQIVERARKTRRLCFSSDKLESCPEELSLAERVAAPGLLAIVASLVELTANGR